MLQGYFDKPSQDKIEGESAGTSVQDKKGVNKLGKGFQIKLV
ncbi:hypothetical protein RintRC_6938 [Richelia intracellularis]|nr:hypothetical protein RintRC_6938 [Richelia intracellularis]